MAAEKPTMTPAAAPAKSEVITINLEPLLVPIAMVLSALIIGGSLIISANIMSRAGVLGANTAATGDTAADTGTPTSGTVSIDDDPVLGNKETAKVAIVEFSDYECPFCKRHFTDSHGQIVDNYVKTGKAILVFRDFPLSFHDPLATQQAMAANCVREQGGDSKYYEYHDILFRTTNSNGNGMAKSQLYTLAEQVGVDKGKFTTCLDSEKFKDEIAKDIADGQASGVTGTPSFFVGKLGSDGKVTGQIISGAMPYATFQAAIEAELAK